MENKQLRALFWESADDISPFIKYLDENNIMKPVVWVGKNPNCTHDVHDFDYARYDDYKYQEMPFDLVRKLEQYKPVYMEMFQRNYRPWEQSSYNGKNLHEMSNIFYLTINKLYRIFTENKIEFVFLTRIPHLGADYIMYRMAELLNIPRIAFQANWCFDFENYSEYVYNLDDYGNFSENKVDEEILNSEFDKSSIESILNKYYGYQDIAVSQNTKCQENIFKTLLKEFRHTGTRELSIIRYKRKRDYAKKIEEIANNSPNMNTDYVYFPLHLQPEMSTSLLGGKYCDQVLAIEDLARVLPKDWKIYVKENPSQGYFQRDEYFFTRLMNIPNVEFVGKSVSSIELIKHSKLVSVITGTAGWEAILIGKPVIVFGQAWYLNFPGVHKYTENINIEDVLNTKVTHDDIYEYAKIYRAKMAPFNLNIYAEIDKFKSQANIEKFGKFMKKQLEMMSL